MIPYLDAVVQREIDAGVLAGAALGVWRRGELCHRANYGMAELETQTPMPDRGIFRLYSASKPITAVAVLLLAERGLLDLFDPVERYLPGFANQTVCENGVQAPAARAVTIRDLLTMTGGVVYPDADAAGSRMAKIYDAGIAETRQGRAPGTVEMANRMGGAPLAFQPGSAWRYGSGAEVLGAVVEVVSGRRFGDFLRSEIFTPLGMEDTAFFVPPEKRNRLVQMYHYSEQAPHLTPYTGDNLMIWAAERDPAFQSGGAGLFSTVEDYGKFANMLLRGGACPGGRILSEGSVRLMRTPQLTPAQHSGMNWSGMEGYSYGDLVRVLTDPAAAATNGNAGEFGWDGWAGVYMAVDPAAELVFVYFISRIDYDNVSQRRKLRAVVYGGQQ